jgi:hypothetical protein
MPLWPRHRGGCVDHQPLAAALNASQTPEFTRYDLLPANWWFLGGACLVLLAFLYFRTWQLTRPLVIFFCLVAVSPARAADEVIDLVMYTDPDVPTARVVKVFPPRLTSLWLQALERPENDLASGRRHDRAQRRECRAETTVTRCCGRSTSPSSTRRCGSPLPQR